MPFVVFIVFCLLLIFARPFCATPAICVCVPPPSLVVAAVVLPPSPCCHYSLLPLPCNWLWHQLHIRSCPSAQQQLELDIIASALLVDVAAVVVHFLHNMAGHSARGEGGGKKRRAAHLPALLCHVYRSPRLHLGRRHKYFVCLAPSALHPPSPHQLFAPSALAISLSLSLPLPSLSLSLSAFASIIIALFSFLKIMCVLLPDRDQHKMLQAELFPTQRFFFNRTRPTRPLPPYSCHCLHCCPKGVSTP